MNGAGRPTTPSWDDLSPGVPRTSTVPLSELDLVEAYRGDRAEPCACGEVILADPRCAMPEVAEHNETPAHQAWRRSRAG